MRGPGVGSGLSGERGLSGQEAGADTEVAELLPFLVPGARADLQAAAAQHVLALTGVGSGRTLLAGQTALLRALIDLAVAPTPAPSRDASRALVNLAADPDLHWQMLAADPELPVRLLLCVLDPQWPWAEELAAVLANLSREPAPCAALTEKLMAAEPERLGLERLVNALCMPSYNASAPLHYLGPLLSNLSQQAEDTTSGYSGPKSTFSPSCYCPWLGLKSFPRKRWRSCPLTCSTYHQTSSESRMLTSERCSSKPSCC